MEIIETYDLSNKKSRDEHVFQLRIILPGKIFVCQQTKNIWFGNY